MRQKYQLTADLGQVSFGGWLDVETRLVWVCICYSNGKNGHSSRA